MAEDRVPDNDDPAKSTVPRYAELCKIIDECAADFMKFYRDGNKAAGTRVRTSMQRLKAFAQVVRTEVQTIKNQSSPASEASHSEGDADES